MASSNLKKYIDIAQAMVEDDKDRDTEFQGYEDTVNLKWDLPKELEADQYIRRVVSSHPYASVEAGTRVLAVLDPKITYQPLASNADTKELANKVEKILSWQLYCANTRRHGTVEQEITRSAILYSEAIANVVDLDYQIKQVEVFEGDTKRLKAARRHGRFLVNVYNPRSVHVTYSNMMPERVLLAQVKPAQEVVHEWGKLAAKLKDLAEDSKNVKLFDYWDYEVHAVWAEPEEGGPEAAMEILAPKEHNLPFLPWAARKGGAHPMLYSIYKTGQWETQNIVRTLATSEVIVHAAAPRFKEEGPSSERTTIDYGDPGGMAKVPTGNVLTPMPPPPIDRALTEIDDRIASEMDMATVSRILINADVPSGSAFASLNMATQTALGALKPFKRLAEQTLSDVFSLMLLWAHETEQDIYGRGRGKDLGEEYMIAWDEIDPEAMYITVELTPDVPTDRQARINAASIAVQQLQYPLERALEDIGVTDPGDAIKQHYFETMTDASIQLMLQNQQQMQQLQLQMLAQQMQMQMQAAMTQGQTNPALPPENGGQAPGGIPGAGGQGMNPAMGGQPAQMMAPGATREGQTGVTQAGVPVAGGAV